MKLPAIVVVILFGCFIIGLKLAPFLFPDPVKQLKSSGFSELSRTEEIVVLGNTNKPDKVVFQGDLVSLRFAVVNTSRSIIQISGYEVGCGCTDLKPVRQGTDSEFIEFPVALQPNSPIFIVGKINTSGRAGTTIFPIVLNAIIAGRSSKIDLSVNEKISRPIEISPSNLKIDYKPEAKEVVGLIEITIHDPKISLEDIEPRFFENSHIKSQWASAGENIADKTLTNGIKARAGILEISLPVAKIDFNRQYTCTLFRRGHSSILRTFTTQVNGPIRIKIAPQVIFVRIGNSQKVVVTGPGADQILVEKLPDFLEFRWDSKEPSRAIGTVQAKSIHLNQEVGSNEPLGKRDAIVFRTIDGSSLEVTAQVLQ